MKKILKWIRQHILCNHDYVIERKMIQEDGEKLISTCECKKCGYALEPLDWKKELGDIGYNKLFHTIKQD